MRRIAITLFSAVALMSAVPVSAQTAAGRPLELGVGPNLVASPVWGSDLRMTLAIPVNDQRSIEVFAGPFRGTASRETLDFMFGNRRDIHFDAMSGIQVRQIVGERLPGIEKFLAFGAVGIWGHDQTSHTRMVIPPVIGLAGGGVQYVLGPHLAIRVDAEALVFVIPIGVRFGVSVFVPIGRYSSVKGPS